MNPKLIVIAGTSSNSGKTTLLCELLKALSGEYECEAIKLTRGHYRSCGKDPHACCVSDLLGGRPTIRRGRGATYAPGKDTGRYWDAGARQVQWVIATDDQVEEGINAALAGASAEVVLIEGTSVLRFVRPDFAVLALRCDEPRIKPSARRALAEGKLDAAFCLHAAAEAPPLNYELPVYPHAQWSQLLAAIRAALKPDAARSHAVGRQTRTA